MKDCKKCGENKPILEFVRAPKYKDGRMNKCKACSAEERRETYSKDPEKYRNRSMSWAKENPDKILAARKKYYLENPEKVLALRQASGIRNKQKSLEYGRAWYAANSEYKKQKAKEWYENNIDKAQESARIRGNASYAANPEIHLARQKEYRSKNPEAMAALSRKYKANRKGATGSHTGKDILFIFNSQRGLCANCNKKLFKSGKNKYHVDHVIALARGGSNWPDNLQCLCPSCNMSKGAKDPIAWAQENGRLL